MNEIKSHELAGESGQMTYQEFRQRQVEWLRDMEGKRDARRRRSRGSRGGRRL